MGSSPGGPELPVARCGACGRDVLCCLDLEDGREILRCLDCATPADAAAVRWLDLHAVEELGYGAVLPEGGCGRPECGRGRCGRADPA
jgi:hypothetical protein